MNKKTVALMLSVSMILSGVGAGNMPYRAKAENTGSTAVVKTGTGSSIASPEISENPSDTAEEVTAAPVSTAAVTQVPDETAIPGEPESPEPSDASGEETTKPSTTPAVTQIPDVAELRPLLQWEISSVRETLFTVLLRLQMELRSRQ